jgi:hypothetical protein
MAFPAAAPVIDLGPGKYQTSLNLFRNFLERRDAPYLQAEIRTPQGESVGLQFRTDDGYLLAFRGDANQWYSVGAERGALGRPCGIGGNYNNMGRVGGISYDDLKSLGKLASFSLGQALEPRLIAILIAVTAEASRFATVATYFTGLTNSVGTQYAPYLQGSVDFDHLLKIYFNQWANPPGQVTQPGQVGHFTSGEILLPRKPK